MGHMLAHLLFVADYNQKVGEWNHEQSKIKEASLLYTLDPINQRLVDLSLYTFVDDITNTFVSTTAQM